jgi:hypothetical protein
MTFKEEMRSRELQGNGGSKEYVSSLLLERVRWVYIDHIQEVGSLPRTV